MKKLEELKTKIFADGADLSTIQEMYQYPYIKGFTTNPTLMWKSGISHYEQFSRQLLEHISDLPVSFEVFSDDFDEMKRQALKIAGWGKNVYVKIPVTNSRAESSLGLIHQLAVEGIKLNVTALMTWRQVQAVSRALGDLAPSFVSVFAGRISDTGRDPMPMMKEFVEIISQSKSQELIWASPRELFNIFQADEIGCHIITVTHDILKKIPLIGKDLDDYSLETVRMFQEDSRKACYFL